MFKDEKSGKQITEFVGLRAKLCSHKTDDFEEKKCKGVKKSVIKRDINFEDYKKCLFEEKEEIRSMDLTRSEMHNVFQSHATRSPCHTRMIKE